MTSFMRTVVLTLALPVSGVMLMSAMPEVHAQQANGDRAVIEIIQIMHREPHRIRAVSYTHLTLPTIYSV